MYTHTRSEPTSAEEVSAPRRWLFLKGAASEIRAVLLMKPDKQLLFFYSSPRRLTLSLTFSLFRSFPSLSVAEYIGANCLPLIEALTDFFFFSALLLLKEGTLQRFSAA